MISLSNFSFPFLQLLAAIFISAFVNRVVAAPTSVFQKRATKPFMTCQGTQWVASGYYAGGTSSQLPIKNIPWSRYSLLTYAYATTSANSSDIFLDKTSASLLSDFSQYAHANGVSPLLSIGGLSGSLYFSTSVNEKNVSSFAQAALAIAQKYQLNGLEFDWEYPTQAGIGCNTMSPSDSANFLQLLKIIRQDSYGATLILSAAVGLQPFIENGKPMTNVSDFASVLDYITIMNYDVWGNFSNAVGPNAPLQDHCSTTPKGSAASAVKAWSGAGFPTSKMLLGSPTYGHGYFVSPGAALNSTGGIVAYPPFNTTNLPQGDRDSGTPSTDVCGNSVPGDTGIFTFQGMISEGFLNPSGVPAPGIDYRIDNCSLTPFLYNSTSQIMISYDDVQSFTMKGSFINSSELLGFSLWDISGDSDNILVDAIGDPIGLSQGCSVPNSGCC